MSCLIYACHNIAPLPPGIEEPGTTSLRAFSRQIRWLKRLGVKFIGLNDLLAWLEGKQDIPDRSAVLTFDDAYRSISEHVIPLLIKEEIPCAVFVIAGYIGCESDLYAHRGGKIHRHLDVDEIKTLLDSEIVELGAHGYHHLDFTKIDATQLRFELKTAKEFLENTFKVDVPYLAYPYGKTTDSVIEEVIQSGYKLAFTTCKKRITSQNVDLLRLPRVNWGRRATLFKLFKYYFIPFATNLESATM